MPGMMQMALLSALMMDDNIPLLLVKDVFTLNASLCPENLVHVLALTHQSRGGKEQEEKKTISFLFFFLLLLL